MENLCDIILDAPHFLTLKFELLTLKMFVRHQGCALGAFAKF